MGQRPAVIKHLTSSGGVIFRKDDTSVQVALIAGKNLTVWTLPKGMIDKGEDAETAALREIREETGLIGSMVDLLGQKAYWFYLKKENVKCRKTVTYFLVQYIEGDTADHCSEVEDARWFDIDEAIAKINFKSDKEILLKAKEKIWAL